MTILIVEDNLNYLEYFRVVKKIGLKRDYKAYRKDDISLLIQDCLKEK